MASPFLLSSFATFSLPPPLSPTFIPPFILSFFLFPPLSLSPLFPLSFPLSFHLSLSPPPFTEFQLQILTFFLFFQELKLYAELFTILSFLHNAEGYRSLI